MATKKNTTKAKFIEATEVHAALETVKEMELSKVVSEIGQLQVSVQGTLSNLSATLANKIQQVEQVDAAINAKQTRLKELCGIENEAVSLDEMRAHKDEEEKTWDKERAERAKIWSEEKAEREKQWKRERDEHDYVVAQQAKKSAEEFETVVERNKRLESIRQEMLNRSWDERENALKSKESEFTTLKDTVAGIDARIKAEVAKAEAVVSNTLKKQYEHQVALLNKDVEADKTLHAAKVASLEGTIKSQAEAIAKLETQLVAARNDARDVATQALQASSEKKVAEALRHVVDTQSVPSKTK